MDVNDGTVAAVVEIPATQPAPGADDQKPIPPEGEAPAEPQQETTEQQEARKQSKFQRRLDRQKTARIEAETEARILREERDTLRAKLDAQSKPQGTEEPKRENFDSDDAFLKAFIRHEARAEVAERSKSDREAQQGREQQTQAQQGTEKVAKDWGERETAFQAATKDYEAVVGPFVDDELQSFSKPARMAIVESEVGPALLYHLAQNPDEADRIAKLSPVRQAAELGKLEAKVSMPAKRTTNAPPPAAHTSGGKTATTDLARMSQEEYEAHRKTQGARWAR